MKSITKNEAAVGAFLLVALALGAVLIVANASGAGWRRGTKRFVVKTEDGQNLVELARVLMNGISVLSILARSRDRTVVRFTQRASQRPMTSTASAPITLSP